jgi:hypothetical protein
LLVPKKSTIKYVDLDIWVPIFFLHIKTNTGYIPVSVL